MLMSGLFFDKKKTNETSNCGPTSMDRSRLHNHPQANTDSVQRDGG